MRLTRRGKTTLAVVALATLLVGAVLFFRGGSAQKTAGPPSCDGGPCAEGPDAAKPRAPNPHRRDRCADVKCSECPKGTKAHQTPGECCPSCLDVDDEACRNGLAQYDARRAELDEELRACKVDSDCMYASFGDACRSHCPTPVNKLEMGAAVEKLREEAAVYCERCLPSSFECPSLDTRTVQCSKGRCEFRADGGPS